MHLSPFKQHLAFKVKQCVILADINFVMSSVAELSRAAQKV